MVLGEISVKELSAGEKAVGLTFNPSNDETVQKLKELFAEAFNIVEKSVPADDGTSDCRKAIGRQTK